MKEKGTNKISNFNGKRAQWIPIQKEIKVRKKRKGPVAFKPDSPYGRALDKTAESFEEAVMQFLIGGGKLWTKDVIAYVTGKNNPKELKNYIGMYANDGIHMDVLHEHLPNSFGIEDKGAMDEINAIVEVMDHYRTKKAMVKELLRRIDQPFEQELAPEYVIEQMEDATEENIEDTVPETVDNLLAQILASSETMSIFTSGRYFDENNNINWDKLKDLAEKDPEHFTFFPFSLNETEFKNFKTLLNDAERQRELSRKIKGTYPLESGGEGDILWPGTPGDEKGDRPAAEEPSEEPSEPEVKKPATEEKKPEFIGEYLENKKVAWSAPAVGIIQSATADDVAYPSDIKSGTDKVSGNSPQTTSKDEDTKKEEVSQAAKSKNLKFAGEFIEKISERFLKASDGSEIFGFIRAETGLKEAPIKLVEGDKNFGKYHIHLKHGKQIKEAGYSSIEEFVELVAKNYNQIRKGSRPDRDTYLLEVNEKHNNTLFVELSKDGSYWNVNSAGIFREAYSRNKEIIWSASEVQNQQPGTVDENLRSAQITGTSYTPPTGTSPETISLQGKDTKTEENKQALQQKKIEPTKGSQEAIDWDSPPAETDEKAAAKKTPPRMSITADEFARLEQAIDNNQDNPEDRQNAVKALSDAILANTGIEGKVFKNDSEVLNDIRQEHPDDLNAIRDIENVMGRTNFDALQYRGKIYLVSSLLRSGKYVRIKIMHELLHSKLRSIDDSGLVSLYDQLGEEVIKRLVQNEYFVLYDSGQFSEQYKKQD